MKRTISLLLCVLLLFGLLATPGFAQTAETEETQTAEAEETTTEEITTQESENTEPAEDTQEPTSSEEEPVERGATPIQASASATATLEVLNGYDRLTGQGGILYSITAGVDIFGASYSGMNAYNESVKLISGRIAYCVQPGKSSDGDKTRTVDPERWSLVSNDMKTTLGLIIFYGYHTYDEAIVAEGESSYLAQYKRVMNYMATQMLIWEVCAGARSTVSNGFQLTAERPYTFPSDSPLYGLPTQNTTYYKTIKLVYDNIVADVQQHWKRPRFTTDSAATAPEYVLTYNPSTGYFECTLPTDKQDTLYGFEGKINLPSGVSFVQDSNGKVLGFRATAAGASTLLGGYTSTSTAYDTSATSEGGCCTLYGHETAQDVVVLNATPDPAYAYFKLQVAGKLRLQKVSNDAVGLSDKKVTVYYSATTYGTFTKLADFVSDSDGVFYVASVSGDTWTKTAQTELADCADGQYRFVEWDVGTTQQLTGLKAENTDCGEITHKYTAQGEAEQLTASTLRGLSADCIGAWYYDVWFDAATESTGSLVGNEGCKVTLTNTVSKSLEILKTADNGVVAGIVFTVKAGTTTVATGTTDQNGRLQIDGSLLTIGKTYTVTEEVPTGYLCDQQVQQVTICEGVNTLRFYNRQIKGSLRIVKKSGSTDLPLQGAGFRVFREDGTQIAEGYTNEDGVLLFENLPYGNYYYQEFAQPEGFVLDTSRYPFSVTEDGEVIEAVRSNTPAVGSITVYKIDHGGEALAGATFLLEYSLDNGENWSPIRRRSVRSAPAVGYTTSSIDKSGQLTTGENGEIKFSGLMVSNGQETILYRLTEVSAPEGYNLLTEPAFVGSLPYDGETNIELTVVNMPDFVLPNTGGHGNSTVCLWLAVLCTAAMAAVFFYLKKREGQEV